MEQLKKSSFRFPVNSNLVIEVAVVFMVIAVVYIVFGYLGNLSFVGNTTKGYINDTILMWVTVVGVIMLAIIIAILFLVINVLRKKK